MVITVRLCGLILIPTHEGTEGHTGRWGSPNHLLRPLDTYHHGRGHCLQRCGIIMGCRGRAFVDCTRVTISLLNTSEFSIRSKASPLKMAHNSLNLMLCLLSGICEETHSVARPHRLISEVLQFGVFI